MVRSMSRVTGWLASAAVSAAAVAALAGPTLAQGQSDTRPVVVVFTFTNSSIGAKSDYEGLSTGIQDLLITDLASSSKIRLVDRARIGDLLQEQSMTRAGQIDPQTAVRLGKILGAQYAITGGFIADKTGKAVMTSHTIDIETSQISNPEKIAGKADDVLGMIAELSSKVAANLNFAPKSGRPSGGTTDAGGKTGSATSGSPSGSSRPARAETYAKQLPTNVVEKTMKTRLDAATMKLYSRALDEIDAKNNAKAADLLRQVKAKFPEFEPAQRNLDKLMASAGD